MKLIGTEIDDASVQLTYTDGPAAPEATKVLIVRMPLTEGMKKSILWHQMKTVEGAMEVLEADRRRLFDEIRKAN